MNPLYLDYEQLLLGNAKLLSPFNFFGVNPGGTNQKNALSCIRYGLEQLLGWDLQTSRKKFDKYTIQLMKMERLVEYIDFPPEIEFGDPKYILHLLYPDEIHINHKELIEKMYQRVIDGECQFPREYFLGQNGFYRFSICLCYMISNYYPVDDVEELYEFFSSAKGRKFLDRYRLKVPMEHLNIDILKSIYSITDDEPESKMYYYFYKFKEPWNTLLLSAPQQMQELLDSISASNVISEQGEVENHIPELVYKAYGCLCNLKDYEEYEVIKAKYTEVLSVIMKRYSDALTTFAGNKKILDALINDIDELANNSKYFLENGSLKHLKTQVDQFLSQ